MSLEGTAPGGEAGSHGDVNSLVAGAFLEQAKHLA